LFIKKKQSVSVGFYLKTKDVLMLKVYGKIDISPEKVGKCIEKSTG